MAKPNRNKEAELARKKFGGISEPALWMLLKMNEREIKHRALKLLPSLPEPSLEAKAMAMEELAERGLVKSEVITKEQAQAEIQAFQELEEEESKGRKPKLNGIYQRARMRMQ